MLGNPGKVGVSKMLDQEKINLINQLIVNKFKAYLIILFGSWARGTARADSDVDIGFLSDGICTSYDIFMAAQELAGLLGKEVDLIDLQGSSTVFQALVVGNGKVIYCTDENRKHVFQIRVLKEYALLNEERAEILEKVRERGSVYGQ